MSRRQYRTVREYVRLIGKYLYGDPAHFPVETKYTLEPLYKGPQAIAVGELANEIRSIQLTWVVALERRRERRGSCWFASDVFAYCEENGIDMKDYFLEAATFEIEFANREASGKLYLELPSRVRYPLKVDPVIFEQWMEASGYIVDVQSTDAPNEDDLAIA
jgi:hypothetical protein